MEIKSYPVEVKSLDFHGLNVFFLKIDVEGSEVEVLRGGEQTIIRSKPIILAEIHSLVVYEAIAEFLNPIGYVQIESIQRLDDGDLSIVNGAYSSTLNNYLWLPYGTS